MTNFAPLIADDIRLSSGKAKVGSWTRPVRWPAVTPIVSTLPPVMPFDPELLPEALRDYVVDVSERQQSPVDFGAVVSVVGLAAIIGNKYRIRPKSHDDWLIVPNLWGAIIGRPSAMKSPAMQSALAPVYMIQDELRRLWEERCRALDIDGTLAGLDEKQAKQRAAKALKAGDRDAAKQILSEIGADDAEEPPCPRIIVNDMTVEKGGELLNENKNGLFLVRDELPGFLARLESEDAQSERAFYLEAFNGDGSFTYDRIGRGTIHIENCTLSIIGGVQPSRIAPIVKGALSGRNNDGLIQRLQMTVWPDDVGDWKWVDRTPDGRARIAYDRVFKSLHDLPRDPEGPIVLSFTAEAQAMFRTWMEELQAEARSGSLASTLESHILKMPKTIASLALIFELADGGFDAVGATATARALDWADYLRSHANRLYAAGQTMTEDGARLIVERRAQLPNQFTARDVQRKAWAGLSDRDAVASAIEILVETHHCREVAASNVPNSNGGRPSTAYEFHPSLISVA